MSYRLKTNVTAVEQGGQGRVGTFGPDSDLSAPENAWVLEAVSNPDVWDGEKPPLREPKPTAVPVAAVSGDQAELDRLRSRVAELEQQLAARTTELEAARAAAPTPEQPPAPKVPPMRGAGSGADDWRAYARSVDVEVAADASREDVVAALTAAGKPIK